MPSAGPAGGPLMPQPPADGDHNRGAGLIWMQTILTAIATALVLARLYVRSTIVRNLGLDDLFIVFGLLLSIVTLGLDGVQIHDGLGRHQYYLMSNPKSMEGLVSAVKYGYITQMILILSTMFTRVSICFFLLKIFGSRKIWRYGLYSVMTFAVVTNIASAVTVPTECRPVAKLWDTTLPGSCWTPATQIAVGDFQGAVAVFCDWVLALLPIAFLWDIQMKLKIKLSICGLMGLGVFTGVCALIRTLVFKSFDPSDITWNLIPMILWSVAEQNIGIIAACIPALKPLFKKDLRFPWSKNWSYPWSKNYDSGGYRAQSDSEQQLSPLSDPQKGVYYPNVPKAAGGVGTGRHVVEIRPPGERWGKK